MAKKNEDGFEPIEDSIEWVDETPAKGAPKNMGMFSAAAQGIPTSGNMPLISPPEAKDLLTGAAQGAANVGIGYANFLPGVNIPKRNFAPQNPFAEVGEDAAEFGSYFLPGGLAKIFGKGVRSIPFIANAIKGVIPTLEKRSTLNALTKMGKAGSEGAVANAALGEKEEQGANALQGAGVGAGANALTQMMAGNNPILSALMRAGVGGFIGADLASFNNNSPTTGMMSGALAGLVAPKVLKSVGVGGLDPGKETLKYLRPDETLPAAEAGNALKTILTPGEASGNPYVRGLEERYGKRGEGAAEKTTIGLERAKNEKNAINEFLNKIFPTTDKNAENKLLAQKSDLYDQSLKQVLAKKEFNELKKDPAFVQAMKDVQSISGYQRKLKNMKPNQYEYLNQIKVRLDDMSTSAFAKQENTLGREYADASKQLLAIMDKNGSPEYAQARSLAQREIVRNNILEKLKTDEISAKNFYTKLLSNDNEYDDLLKQLKNMPEAAEDLKKMKLAWKNLVNLPKKVNSTEKELKDAHSLIGYIGDLWHSMAGQKRNKEALRYINSKDWQNDLLKIKNIKDGKEKQGAFADLFGKITGGGILTAIKSQGSEKNGTELRTGT